MCVIVCLNGGGEVIIDFRMSKLILIILYDVWWILILTSRIDFEKSKKILLSIRITFK